MATDNTDSVSMDFLTTQTLFLGRRVPKYLVNTDEVTRTGDLACRMQAVYGCIRCRLFTAASDIVY